MHEKMHEIMHLDNARNDKFLILTICVVLYIDTSLQGVSKKSLQLENSR